MNSSRISKRIHRHKRVRAKIFGTAARPRMSVFRSNRRLWLQLVDDAAGRTLIAAESGVSAGKKGEGKPMERAQRAGMRIAEKAGEKKIMRAVFDRGGYAYHGLVKAAAEGARKGGLKL